jgi:O-antigen/teichoic acid export membrane protein
VTLATIIHLSRFLGPDGFGRYSFLYSGLFLILTLFNVNGLNDILTRDLSAKPGERNRIYQNGLALKLIAGFLAFIVAVILILTTDGVTIPKTVACIGALTLFVSFTIGSYRQVWDVPYQVDFRMIPNSIINLLGRIFFLVALIVLSAGGQRSNWFWGWFNSPTTNNSDNALSAVIVLQTLVEIAAMAGLGLLNKKYQYPMRLKWNSKTIRYLIVESWPLAVAGGLVMIYSKVNVLLLQFYLSERDVGLYAAPMRIADALVIVPTVFLISAMPILSVLHKKSEQRFHKMVALSFRMMLIASLMGGAVAVFYSRPLMALVYSPEYISAAPVLAVLVGGTLFTFSAVLLSGLLIVIGEQKLLMVLYALQTLISLTLNIGLIPQFGIIGASVASLVTYFSIFSLILLWKRVRRLGLTWFKVLITPLIAAFIAGVLVKSVHFSLVPALVIIPVIFLVLVWILGGWKKDDWALLKEMMAFRSTPAPEKAEAHE